ncbi:MAG: 2-C-methyl-D-erythritol 4-phosphate cytidylyltransferase, partial [Marinilabiliaceae bacterium]
MESRYVIFVAGGRGRRMGNDVPKQFLEIGSRPVLMLTIDRFVRYSASLQIILVLPEDQIPVWQQLCQTHNFQVKHIVVSGGETRYGSVKNGLNQVGDEGLVAIHDGVRPFVSPETIDRCFEVAQKHGAAVPVMEFVETIRKVGGQSSEVVPRDDYRLVQTPQVFRVSLIKDAYDRYDASSFTDDASVAEAAGYEITLVEGNRENIKITSPFDMLIANALA